MPVFQKRIPWRKKPEGLTRAKNDSSIAFYLPAHEGVGLPRNIITGTAATQFGSPLWEVDEAEGRVIRFNGGTDYYTFGDLTTRFSDQATLILRLRLSTNTPTVGAETGIGFGGGTGGNRTHYPFTDGKLYISTLATSRLVSALDNSGFDKSKWHQLVITTKPGSGNYQVYQNTTLIASATGPDTVNIPSDMPVGNWAGIYLNGQISHAIVLNRWINQGTVDSLYENPYQFIEPRRRYIPFSSGAGSPTHEVSLALGASLNQSINKTADFNAALSFLTGLGYAASASSITGASVSLGAIQSAGFTTGQILQEAITLALSAGQTQQGAATFGAALNLSNSQLSGFSSAATFDSTLNLGLSQSIGQAAGQDLQAAIALALSAGQSQDNIVSIEGSVTLNLNLTKATSANAVMGASLPLNQVLTSNLSATGVLGTAISLAVQQGYNTTNGNTVEGALSLALQAGVNTSALVTIEGAITLNTAAAMSAEATGNLNGQISLGAAYGLELVKTAIMDAGLTLGNIHSITQNGATLILGIITPAGRIVTIALEDRTVLVAAENRTITIH